MSANLCEADRERRARAVNDAELVARVGDMERRITFEVGYDHMAFPDQCGGGGHGRHGMTVRFILVGPLGATQWVFNLMNFIPGNAVTFGVDPPDSLFSAVVPTSRRLDRDAMPIDLGYHSPKPRWGDDEWQQERRECEILPDGYCYYDGSGLNAEPVMAAFLEHGPMAVWATLARYYGETFGREAAR